jgi:hypothetical protein
MEYGPSELFKEFMYEVQQDEKRGSQHSGNDDKEMLY